MTDQIPMRSASERRDAARPVLTWLGVYADRAREIMTDIDGSREAESMDDVFAARDDADNHLGHYVRHIEKQREILEALLEVPEVGITEDELVADAVAVVLGELDLGGDRTPSIAHLLDAFRSGWLNADDVESAVRRIGRAAVRGAEQAALEHWEPADAPSQEFMLRHLGITARPARISGETRIFIPAQYIEREVI